VDLHSYQPTAEDMLAISNCDVFLYVGGESDAWVEDALQESGNPDRIAVNLLDVLGDAAKQEEVVEGMKAEEESNDEEGEEEEPEYDEHVWLSLNNAQVLTSAIADALGQADPDHAELYQSNAADYQEQLAALEEQYQDAVDSASQKTILFGDRFPFRYLADDYGLDYYAAFVGCSAETEASFETITFLANKVDELGLNSILTIENSDQKLAQTILQNTKDKNQQILTLNSLQSITSDDVDSGATYLSLMEDNLDVLKQALQ
ncbi:MAG: metal ABC transporter substrate-binding protein, partial [Butyricicoccus sp.]